MAARRPMPKPPGRKQPVVLRRFGATGRPVPISRRTNDLGKREGLRVYEDGSYGERQGKSKPVKNPKPSDQAVRRLRNTDVADQFVGLDGTTYATAADARRSFPARRGREARRAS
jgi:hypothetical protein